MNKLYPENRHMGFYTGWHFLGNDGECDYYVLPWELVDKDNRLTFGKPWVSVVYSNEASDYASPDYELILSKFIPDSHAHYLKMRELLLSNGYHLTGRTL